MSLPIAIDPMYYTFPQGFNHTAHTGLQLIHVGLETKHFALLSDYAKTQGLTTITATPTRISDNDFIYDWVDVEFIATSPQFNDALFDNLDLFLNEHLTDQSPYSLALVDYRKYPHTGRFDITCTSNTDRFSTAPTPLQKIYTFEGIRVSRSVSPDTMHRLITIHPSKECAVVNSYLSNEMILPRTAARLYIAPYVAGSEHLFTFGITGEVILSRLQTDHTQVTLGAAVVNELLGMSKEQQYHVGLLITAHRRLRGGISAQRITDFIKFLGVYQSVVDVILGAPGPSNEELAKAFLNVFGYESVNDLPF